MRLLESLPPKVRLRWMHEWLLAARDDQLPPPGVWRRWLIMGGRGAGKTRAGAEFIRALVLGRWPQFGPAIGRIALVADSYAEARDVMIEGVSGLLAIHPAHERPQWKPSLRRLTWPNGAVAQVFSAEDPEGLRGPQFGAAWCDELAKWRGAEATYDNLQFGLRLGVRPVQVITTTPRTVPVLRRLLQMPDTVVSRAATHANAAHLSPDFLAAIEARYGGTRLARQEIAGELIEDRNDALWTRGDLERCRLRAAPDLARIYIAVDPPASSGSKADRCGIIAAGVDAWGKAYVLADRSAQGLKPVEWARRAVGLCHELKADRLVVEVNQGGEMVASVIREVDRDIALMEVRARRGKWLRAEPVAALYAQGRIAHVGGFAALEDEMCDFGPAGLSDGRSPDRLDALVWVLTALMLREGPEPRVRGM